MNNREEGKKKKKELINQLKNKQSCPKISEDKNALRHFAHIFSSRKVGYLRALQKKKKKILDIGIRKIAHT